MQNRIKNKIKEIVPHNVLMFIKMQIYNNALRIIHPPIIPKNEDGKVLIHLGCGNQDNKKFINVDAQPHPNVHYVRDIRNLSIFPDDFADLIYASHILEHISYLELNTTLKEWARVLKRGGILRLSVPDFDKLLETYKLNTNNILSIQDPLMGGQNYQFNFHKSIFNEKYLSELLINTGFNQLKKWDSMKDNYGFSDFAKKFKASLNIEANKK